MRFHPKGCVQSVEFFRRDPLVHGHTQRTIRISPQGDPLPLGILPNGIQTLVGYVQDLDRIKDRALAYPCTCHFQLPSECAGLPVNLRGNRGKAFRSVVHRIHGGNDGGKNLGRADVAGCLFAPDVLFPRLQGKAQSRPARGIAGNPHHAPRHQSLEFVPYGNEGGMRTAQAGPHAQTLCGAVRHIGTHFPRRDVHGQRQRIGGRRHLGPGGVRKLSEYPVVVYRAVRVGGLNQHPEHIRIRVHFRQRRRDDADVQRARPGFEHLENLRMDSIRNQEDVGLGPSGPCAPTNRHCFRGC